MRVIVLGAFHELIELCELSGYEIVGIIDNEYSGSFMGYSILGTDKEVKELAMRYKEIPLVLGPDSPNVKKRLYQLYNDAGFGFATIISPRAFISKSAIIEEGSIIQSGVNVSSCAHIDRFCKLNFNCNIMHDVRVGAFSIIAPNAVVLGRAVIGEESYIGANATIEHDAVIEKGAKIPTAFYFKSNE